MLGTLKFSNQGDINNLTGELEIVIVKKISKKHENETILLLPQLRIILLSLATGTAYGTMPHLPSQTLL